MRDPVTITLTFERPETEEALAAVVNGMVKALPGPKGSNVRLRMEGVTESFAAVFCAAHALTKAQISSGREHGKRK